mgnify:CR=1 FL=1
MEADGWQCTICKDRYGRAKIDCIHLETQAAIDAAKAQVSDTLEAGVSCFDAEIAADGSYRLLLTDMLEVSYLTIADRPAYRLYGERIGTGADGEPLLRVDRAVKM